MGDIIQTVPWHCGERDCLVGWHQANYWWQEDGSFSMDAYSDGDHEDIEKDELPSDDEVDEAWRKYYADSVETGLDPLDALPVPATRKRKRTWQCEIANSICGPVLRRCRRNGRGAWVSGRLVDGKPRQELCEYLLLERHGPHLVFCDPAGERGNFKDLCNLIDADENCQRQRARGVLKFLVTVEETDPVVGLKNKIRKAARAALKATA